VLIILLSLCAAAQEKSAAPQQQFAGRYEQLFFALRTPGDHPASLAFLWAKEDG
jgi:hypothetical protein